VIGGHLGNIGILAKFTPQVATDGGNGIRKRAWQKVKQGFFFDRINMTRDGFVIDQGQQHAGPVFSNGAYSPAVFFYDAPMAAQIAFDLFAF
jgi:hypothetical protein